MHNCRELSVKWPWRILYRRKWCNIFLKFRCLFMEWVFFCTAVKFFCKKKIETDWFVFNWFIEALIMTISRIYCIQILKEFLYFQNWNWEKNFEVCTLQRTTSRQMVSTFIFGINKCMQKDRKKGTGVKLCTINVLSLLNLRSIWTGRTSSAVASAS
jgi:hypothetical protein